MMAGVLLATYGLSRTKFDRFSLRESSVDGEMIFEGVAPRLVTAGDMGILDRGEYRARVCAAYVYTYMII